MNWSLECVVVIPCLNEGKTIGGLVKAIRRFLPEVLVVDDGSSDATSELAREQGAEVIRRDQPSGKGAALQLGCRTAREHGATWVLTMDGDGQHSPEDIPLFLNAALSEQARLVIGNRMSQTNRMPWLRRKVNAWMSARLSRAAGLFVPDSQCGFRLIHLESLHTLQIQTTHFEIESEVLLGFAARRFKIAFVPIQTIYGAEHSKINPVSDTLRWLRWWAGNCRSGGKK